MVRETILNTIKKYNLIESNDTIIFKPHDKRRS